MSNLPLLFTLLAQSDPAPSKSLWQHIASGGPIGMIIIALSFAAVVLMIVHSIQLRKIKLAPELIVHELNHLLSNNDIDGAERFCQEPDNDSFLTQVIGSALSRCKQSPFGFLEFRAALEEAGADQVAKLYRSTEIIGFIATVSPMLGLLGTVVGMVGAFDTISTSEGFARPDQLAGSISVALITTVLGLIVAIPCTAAFTFFRNRIDHLAVEVSKITEQLLAHVEAPPAAPTAAPAARKAQPR